MTKNPIPFVALSLLTSFACRPSTADASPVAGGAGVGGAKPLACGVAAGARAVVRGVKGDPRVRVAAQKGLEYLEAAAEHWTEQNKCFGCHVQAVTLEALTVGQHHHYAVPRAHLDAMVNALELGVTAGGHTTGVAFQGQAWARYDQWVDAAHGNDLMRYAKELVAVQQQDGAVPDDDARLPVTGGTMHTTYQAMQTWRQAYARTADNQWLTPMRKAEQFLMQKSAAWDVKSDVYIQDENLALLGLVAAGVGPGEASSQRVQRLLLARQKQDGSWGLAPGTQGSGDALATGQTLYALKLAGHGDGEAAIGRATEWLVRHQAADGAWRTVKSAQGGAEKGEGMWAVLGLVSVDVMSLTVAGVVDGQHVEPQIDLSIEARDNRSVTGDGGGGVAKLELLVDDLPLHGECSAKLAFRWSTAGLTEGKHTLDVVATNAAGQESRRRFDVYAGNVFLTEVGTRFDEAQRATEITVRNIAPASQAPGKVELGVYAVEGDENKPGRQVHREELKSAPGAMTFRWAGAADDGQPTARGRYLAELVLRDGQGKVLQKERALFFQDSEAVQKQTYGEVEGNLGLRGGAGFAANSQVELVDDRGRVVQEVQSTEQGNYRFKNVTAGKYVVRARKAGFGAQAAPVTATPAAAPTKANLTF